MVRRVHEITTTASGSTTRSSPTVRSCRCPAASMNRTGVLIGGESGVRTSVRSRPSSTWTDRRRGNTFGQRLQLLLITFKFYELEIYPLSDCSFLQQCQVFPLRFYLQFNEVGFLLGLELLLCVPILNQSLWIRDETWSMHVGLFSHSSWLTTGLRLIQPWTNVYYMMIVHIQNKYYINK